MAILIEHPHHGDRLPRRREPQRRPVPAYVRRRPRPRPDAIVVIAPLVLAGLAACYVPEFRDCTVACATDADCATGHVCGGRGLCVTPEGSCGTAPPVTDGGPAVADAPMPMPPPADAPPAPADAPPATGRLRIEIRDRGRVEVSNIGTCDSEDSDRCDFIVPLGATRTLIATPHGNRTFDKWEKACKHAGNVPVCVLVPTEPTTDVEAKFRRQNDDDD